jgi:transcriptional regulator with XRE-family HTH domain/molybdate-binding protein
MSSESALRRRRTAMGLTQAELAAAARVSRQLVVAVEAGVNTPSVDAALRLARALRCPAEQLFADADADASAWANARAGIEAGVEARPAVSAGCLVVAGCDPALQIAASMLAGAGEASLLALDATSGVALAALNAGGVHAAVAHGRAGQLQQAQIPALKLHLARWQVGLGIAPGVGAGVDTLAACLEQLVPIVQRDESAAAQQALRRAASALGLELPAGVVASSHAAAAAAAAALSCAAITTEAAARLTGLRFIALESHTVEISFDRRWQQHPGLESLGNVLSSRAFQAEVARMGGYDLSGCGSLLGTTEGER